MGKKDKYVSVAAMEKLRGENSGIEWNESVVHHATFDHICIDLYNFVVVEIFVNVSVDALSVSVVTDVVPLKRMTNVLVVWKTKSA